MPRVPLQPGAAAAAARRVLLSAAASNSSSASSYSVTRRNRVSVSASASLMKPSDEALNTAGFPQQRPNKRCACQNFTAAAAVASLQGSLSSSPSAGAAALLATAPRPLLYFLPGGVNLSIPSSRGFFSVRPSGGECLLHPPRRWTHHNTGRRVSSTSSSEDGTRRGGLCVLPEAATAEEAADCSSRYYVALTALLSSTALWTADRHSRRRRIPAACDAAAPSGECTERLQCTHEFSPSAAAFCSSSARTGPQDAPPNFTCSVTASCRCSNCSRHSSSSSSMSGDSSGWTRGSEKKAGERRGGSRSSSVRRTHMESWCRSKWSSGAYGTWKPRVSAWRGERAVACCAAAERVPWLSAGADFCEVADLPAATGKRRGEGLEDGRAGEQQKKGDTVVSPSLLTKSAADNEQSGQLRSERVADSTAGVSSAVEDGQGGKRRRGDSETGGAQAVALGEGHQRGSAAGEEPPQHHHHDSPLWRSEENRPFERKLEDALLFCGNSNKPLAAAVADRLSTKLGKVAVKRFADGEVNIQFLDSLRGKDVYLIQPTSTPVNEHLMELLLMISTCRRASAKKITAVIPYYGYARQDRKLSSRVPISAADVARMIEAMGVDRVVAVDLHCGQIQGFFGPRVPVDNLEAQIIGLEYFQRKNLQKPVVVSPDAGGVYRARKFQEGLLARGYRDCGIAMLIKQRLRANEIERMDLVGSVEGSDVIIVDDMIDTAGTLCEAARELRAKGARRVFAFATHGLFSGPALNRIESSPLEEVVVTDSIQARREVLNCPRITSLSISVLLADAIRRIHQKESLNDLFMVKSW